VSWASTLPCWAGIARATSAGLASTRIRLTRWGLQRAGCARTARFHKPGRATARGARMARSPWVGLVFAVLARLGALVWGWSVLVHYALLGRTRWAGQPRVQTASLALTHPLWVLHQTAHAFWQSLVDTVWESACRPTFNAVSVVKGRIHRGTAWQCLDAQHAALAPIRPVLE